MIFTEGFFPSGERNRFSQFALGRAFSAMHFERSSSLARAILPSLAREPVREGSLVRTGSRRRGFSTTDWAVGKLGLGSFGSGARVRFGLWWRSASARPDVSSVLNSAEETQCKVSA